MLKQFAVLYCLSVAASAQWTQVANEYNFFTVSNAPKLIRYGAGSSWYYYMADENGSLYCGSGTFGGDPAPGQGKSCYTGDTTNPHPYLGWRHRSLGTIVYSVYIPQASLSSSEEFPLVVNLHPVGDRGTQHYNIGHSDMAILSSDTSQAHHPCFIYAPECPDTSYWVTPNPGPDFHRYRYASTSGPSTRPWLDAMRGLDTILAKYPIDQDRIYLVGGSMGGYGTWYTLMKYPDRFAAAIPVAGGGDTTASLVAPYAHVPVWAFHDPGDGIVDYIGSESMTRAMQRAGGTPRLTSSLSFAEGEYEVFGGHWYVIPFCIVDSLIPWMFSQRRTTSTIEGRASLMTGQHVLAAGRRGLVIQAAMPGRIHIVAIGKDQASRQFDIRGQRQASTPR